MDVDKTLPYGFELRERHRQVVDITAALALYRDYTPYYHGIAVIEIVLFEQRLQIVIRHLELGLYNARGGAVLNYRAVGTGTGKHTYGSQQYRLTGTGLAGYYIEPPLETNIEKVYQYIILYMKRSYHNKNRIPQI